MYMDYMKLTYLTESEANVRKQGTFARHSVRFTREQVRKGRVGSEARNDESGVQK